MFRIADPIVMLFYVCELFLGNGAAVTITSPNSSLSVLTGDTINLTISYSVTPNLILWNYKGSPLAVWTTEVQSIADSYKNRLTLQEKQISIRDSTPADSGEYSVTVTDASGNTGNFKFNVDVAGESLVCVAKRAKESSICLYIR